jgi:hypothetical protein
MRVLALAVACTLATNVAAQTPAPAPAAKSDGLARESRPEAAGPTAAPTGRIEIGHAVAEAVAKMLATPRFEEQIEVRDRYQEALDAMLRSANLECGATSSGPPTPDEMSRFDGREIPPTADLLAGLKWLHGKLTKRESPARPRYFLYSVHLRSTPARSVYVVRDGVLPDDARASVPGAEWVLVASYADRDAATKDLARLQRGAAAPDRPAPPALWAASVCPR